MWLNQSVGTAYAEANPCLITHPQPVPRKQMKIDPLEVPAAVAQ